MNWWILSVDGASQQTGVGIGLQLKSLSGDKIKQAIRLGFSTLDNESEYEAILAGIELAAAISTDKIIIQSDSQLVLGQVNAKYMSRIPRMANYVTLVKQRLGSFSAWKLEHIARDCNAKTDALAVVAVSLLITETILLPIYYQSDS